MGLLSHPRLLQRLNRYTGKQELFDPCQIYVSPVIDYAAAHCYATPERWSDGTARYSVQVCLQVRIRPSTYLIGQQTIGAKCAIDSSGSYSNDEVEWYSRGEERGSIILTGLLIRCVPE